MARALTAKSVEAAKPGAARHEVPDGAFPGLYLVVQPSGVKSWALRYRIGRKPKKLTLGRFPAIGLAEAREEARKAARAIELGDDPAGAKAEAKRREPDTVRSVGEQFIAKYARPRNRTADEVERMFAMHLYPALGHRPIETVTRRDILDVLDTIEAKSSGARANRVLANIRRLFGWAVERGIIEASPAANVRAPGQERARDRVLTDAEFVAFLRACEAMGEPFGPLFRLLLLTGQRREEVAAMPWAEVDMGAALWHLPGERVKNGRAHTVPLASQSMAILESLMRRSPLVFPASFSRDGHSDPRPVSGFGRAKERLDALMLAELRKADPEAVLAVWRLHDLRRTAASGMARLGVPVHVVEALLNHKSGTISGVAAVYNRHDYAAEKRQAAQAWGQRVLALVGEAPAGGNVVALAR